MMTQGSISRLDLEAVLVSAWLYKWEVLPNGDVAVLLKSVKLLDYETGEPLFPHPLDHCWFCIAENHWWRHLWEMAIATGEQVALHDEVWLCCSFSSYQRLNGGCGWRLRLRNQSIVSPPQSRKLQKANADLYRKAAQLRGRDLIGAFTSQCIYQTELEHKATDWRKLGRSYKDACFNVRRNLNALEQQIGEIPGELDLLMERFYQQGSLAIWQMHDRIAEAEQLEYAGQLETSHYSR